MTRGQAQPAGPREGPSSQPVPCGQPVRSPPGLGAGCVWTELSAHCGWVDAGTGEADTWLPVSGGEAPREAWSGLDSGMHVAHS